MSKKLKVYNIIIISFVVLYVIYYTTKLLPQLTGNIIVSDGMVTYYSYRKVAMNLLLIVIFSLIPDYLYFFKKIKK